MRREESLKIQAENQLRRQRQNAIKKKEEEIAENERVRIAELQKYQREETTKQKHEHFETKCQEYKYRLEHQLALQRQELAETDRQVEERKRLLKLERAEYVQMLKQNAQKRREEHERIKINNEFEKENRIQQIQSRIHSVSNRRQEN